MMDKLPLPIIIKTQDKLVYFNQAAKINFEIICSDNNSQVSEFVNQQFIDKFKTICCTNNSSLYDFFYTAHCNEPDLPKNKCFKYTDNINNERSLKAEVWKIEFDSQESLACTIEDLTISLQLERQMLQDKFEKMFLSSFTHELVNPINGIVGTLEYILSENENYKKCNEAIKAAKSACNQLLGLVKNVIEIGRNEQIYADPSDFNLSEAINECYKLYKFALKKKGIKFEKELSKNVPEIIFADKQKYKDILINLIGNSIKYTEQGKITIKCNLEDDNNSLVTSIIDTGIGMSEEQLKKLFVLFSENESRNELNPQGIGIGLTICNKFAETLNGMLSVKSVKNEGTTFILKIPIKEKIVEHSISIILTDEPKPNLCTQKSPPICNSLFKKCICPQFLVVDDNELNRFVIVNLLKVRNLYAEEAINGLKAIELIKNRSNNPCCKSYKIIFMDINMPVMDGTEATKKLKEMMSNKEICKTPIVAVTAAHCRNEEELQKYFEIGFDFFMEKPVTLNKLKEVLIKYNIIT